MSVQFLVKSPVTSSGGAQSTMGCGLQRSKVSSMLPIMLCQLYFPVVLEFILNTALIKQKQKRPPSSRTTLRFPFRVEPFQGKFSHSAAIFGHDSHTGVAPHLEERVYLNIVVFVRVEVLLRSRRPFFSTRDWRKLIADCK